MGPRTTLGRILDTQCAVARADRPVACPWVFQSGVESARSALLRFDCPVLDRPPIVQHLSRVCTEAYRPLLREQPIRFIVLPVLVTAGCFALFSGRSALPWTREERLIGLAIIDYACVTYHFAAQHFGALSLYRSRAERGSCIQTRRFDRFSRSLLAACLFSSRTFSPEQSRIKTSGSIAGFRRGLCRLRTESAAAQCWPLQLQPSC